VLVRTDGTHLAVFESVYALRQFAGDHPEVPLESIVAG
jgi:hypothetical protein